MNLQYSCNPVSYLIKVNSVQLTGRGSARITVAAVAGLVAGNRRDAGAADDAQGGQTSSWKAGEARWTETGLA